MSDLWAYFNKGNNHYQSLPSWGMARPDDEYFKGIRPKALAFYEAMRDHTSDLKDKQNSGRHYIAYDGERWISGFGGLPNSFLDAQKFPEAIYSREGIGGGQGRFTHWFHGYVSKDKTFPNHIPSLSKETVAKLHEEQVIPHWHLKGGGENPPVPNAAMTTYESVDVIGKSVLTETLPPEALEKLKQAHAQGKPIMLSYDAASKTYIDATPTFKRNISYNNYQRDLQTKRETPKASVASSIPAPSASASSESSFFERAINFRNAEGNLRWGKVTGIAIGATAAVGGIYYLLSRPSEKNSSWTDRVENTQSNNLTTRHR